ncbi:MAG: FkbM family methyltransferase [Rhodovulum sulfidophilum]|uniref:FkbM family methyltransferase n=1 Tax=Rhodovulum sulfidophilum TaxID=35806 RepID=A0A2W5N5V2_RHOSU|nr:MAG: FkbM family methyltransferase [Rhodovulum sulfidophilum]
MRHGPRDWAGLARSLVIYRCRPWKARALARLYAEILGPGDLAFDIGAHAGNRTRAMLAQGARVIALEPQPLFHAWLARDLPRGATLLRAAAGARAGRARLAISRLHPTVTSLAPGFAETMAGAAGFGYVRWDAEAEVEVTTLDALIAREGRPRFIKIDVEGAEDSVLAGLSTPVDWIAFEALPALPGVTAAALVRLEALGSYRFNFIPGEAERFALPDWTDAARIAAFVAAAGCAGDVYARLGGADG